MMVLPAFLQESGAKNSIKKGTVIGPCLFGISGIVWGYFSPFPGHTVEVSLLTFFPNYQWYFLKALVLSCAVVYLDGKTLVNTGFFLFTLEIGLL